MALTTRQRLIRLSQRDYRPNAWRRRPQIATIIEQLRDVFNELDRDYGTTTTFTMPAVNAMAEALRTGRIFNADVAGVAGGMFYQTVVVRHQRKATKSIAEWAIANA